MLRVERLKQGLGSEARPEVWSGVGSEKVVSSTETRS